MICFRSRFYVGGNFKTLVGWLGYKTVETIRAREAVKRSAAAILQYIRYRGECIRTPSARGRPHSPRINNHRDFRALYHRLVSVVLSTFFSGSLRVHRPPPKKKTITARTRHDIIAMTYRGQIE